MKKMLSNTPAGSPPIPSHTWSLELFLHTSQLSSSPLLYKSIQQPPSQLNNDSIWAVLKFDLSDVVLANILAVFKNNIKEFKSRSNDENIYNRKKWSEEAVANKIFLNEELEFNEKSDEESIEKSNKESDN